MTAEEALEHRLRHLTPLAPDPTRAARVRARCHVRLDRSRRRQSRRDAAVEFATQVLAPAAVGGVCAVYVACLVVLAYEVGTFEHPLH